MNIEADASRLVMGIFPYHIGDDRIRIVCNWCSGYGYIFFDGLDTDTASSNWLELAVKHLVAKHPDRLADDD